MVLVHINTVPKGGSFHQSAPGCKNGLVMLVNVIFILSKFGRVKNVYSTNNDIALWKAEVARLKLCGLTICLKSS